MVAVSIEDSGIFFEEVGRIVIFTLENASPHAMDIWQDRTLRRVEQCCLPPCLLLHDFTSPRFTSIPYAVKCVLESYSRLRRDIPIRIALVVPQAYYHNILTSLIHHENYIRPANVEEMLFWKKEHALHWLEDMIA